jgi:hypothetical protein
VGHLGETRAGGRGASPSGAPGHCALGPLWWLVSPSGSQKSRLGSPAATPGRLRPPLVLGASLLATAYAISEAFGFRKGVNLDFRRAPLLLGTFSGLVALAAALALVPHLPTVQLLVGVQVLNGIMLPIVLDFMLLLINDARLTGNLKNTPLANALGWGTTALVTIAVVALLAS